MDVDQKSSIDLEKSFHHFITNRLEGEAKMLALNAIVGRAGMEHTSGAELWRLLMYNSDKQTVNNIVNVAEIIKNVDKAKAVRDAQAKFSTFLDCTLSVQKGFMESNEEDIVSARRHLGTMDSRNPISSGSCLTL